MHPENQASSDREVPWDLYCLARDALAVVRYGPGAVKGLQGHLSLCECFEKPDYMLEERIATSVLRHFDDLLRFRFQAQRWPGELDCLCALYLTGKFFFLRYLSCDSEIAMFHSEIALVDWEALRETNGDWLLEACIGDLVAELERSGKPRNHSSPYMIHDHSRSARDPLSIEPVLDKSGNASPALQS